MLRNSWHILTPPSIPLPLLPQHGAAGSQTLLGNVHTSDLEKWSQLGGSPSIPHTVDGSNPAWDVQHLVHNGINRCRISSITVWWREIPGRTVRLLVGNPYKPWFATFIGWGVGRTQATRKNTNWNPRNGWFLKELSFPKAACSKNSKDSLQGNHNLWKAWQPGPTTKHK